MARQKKLPKPRERRERKPVPPRWQPGDRVTTVAAVTTEVLTFRDCRHVPLVLLPGTAWTVTRVTERRSESGRIQPVYTIAVMVPGEYLIELPETRLRPLTPEEMTS